MRYIFFGTPQFASLVLEKLVNSGFNPLAVVTNPDRPVGRKKILTAPTVKAGIGNTIKVLQPEVFDDSFIKELKLVGADVGVLAAYGKIITKEVIDVFPKGIVVVHPSLLPKYRGATPIQSVILNGEKATGVTLFLMDEQVDHGKIISKSQLSISNDDTYETLLQKLAQLSGDSLVDILLKYLEGKIMPKEQEHSMATYTKKIKTEDGFVDFKKESPEIIWRKVRALNPEPGVWTNWNSKRTKILEANFKNGQLTIKKIQIEGGKPQNSNLLYSTKH